MNVDLFVLGEASTPAWSEDRVDVVIVQEDSTQETTTMGREEQSGDGSMETGTQRKHCLQGQGDVVLTMHSTKRELPPFLPLVMEERGNLK